MLFGSCNRKKEESGVFEEIEEETVIMACGPMRVPAEKSVEKPKKVGKSKKVENSKKDLQGTSPEFKMQKTLTKLESDILVQKPLEVIEPVESSKKDTSKANKKSTSKKNKNSTEKVDVQKKAEQE